MSSGSIAFPNEFAEKVDLTGDEKILLDSLNYTTPEDILALFPKITVSDQAPLNPSVGDVWIKTPFVFP